MTMIGILGAGQLGRMLALAGYPLGLTFRFLDPAPASPAGQLAEHIEAGYHNAEALARFLDGLDAVTYEFENVPLEIAHQIEHSVPVYPPPLALEKGQDRLVEKTFFRSLGIPTSEFSDGRLLLNGEKNGMGYPCVLKTRRMGYDGKGQFVVRNANELAQALETLHGQDTILERLVPFDRELSILGVRSLDGATRFYPLVENRHREGILRLSLAPAPELTPELQATAESYAGRVLKALDYVGVLAIELFQVGDHLLANEMAPRVHNSGHWSIEGAVTSQFENHLRALAGLPLGDTSPRGAAAMLNLIGEVPPSESILDMDGAHLHLYAKSARPGRKLGHITFVEKDFAALQGKLAAVKERHGNL